MLQAFILPATASDGNIGFSFRIAICGKATVVSDPLILPVRSETLGGRAGDDRFDIHPARQAAIGQAGLTQARGDKAVADR